MEQATTITRANRFTRFSRHLLQIQGSKENYESQELTKLAVIQISEQQLGNIDIQLGAIRVKSNF